VLSTRQTKHFLLERIKNAVEEFEQNLKDQRIMAEAASGIF